MSLLINDVTLIDGVADKPIEGRSISIDKGRIKAIGGRDELRPPASVQIIDARGKYVIPGLMNANVHLLMDLRLENLARYHDHYEDLIAEAAQVALKSGITTVFDTYGPRRYLMAVRDKIDAGILPGSRIFCAGNIIGFDGPFSPDFEFMGKVAEIASATLVNRINAIWVENVGRQLMWLPPKSVAEEVRAYIAKGIDFIKYGSNDHFPGAFLAFSRRVQAAMVDVAHRAGTTAQAHTMSVEGLRIAIEAGCDLIQHANITGPVTIPEETLGLLTERKTAAVVFPWPKRGLDWIKENVVDMEWNMWMASDTNARNLIRSGATLLMANDGSIFAPEIATDRFFSKSWMGAPQEIGLGRIGQGHFIWFQAMEEKECPPMQMLKAATRNVAVAYGKGKDLGTLEVGKIADLLILDKNPLQAAENYRSINMIIKDGVLVDRQALPVKPILTRPLDPPPEEAASYKPFFYAGPRFPMSPMCMCR